MLLFCCDLYLQTALKAHTTRVNTVCHVLPASTVRARLLLQSCAATTGTQHQAQALQRSVSVRQVGEMQQLVCT